MAGDEVPRPSLAFLVLAFPATGAAQAPVYETLVVAEPEEEGVPAAWVSTVRPEEDPRAGASVSEALDSLPGVAVRSIGGLGTFGTVSIRGSTGSQVRVVLDGIPLATTASGVANVGDVSLESLEEIRVHRGAAPPALGGGAIGGVVELRTAEPGRSPRFETSATAGSFDTLRLSTLSVGRVEGVRYSTFAGTSYTRGDFEFHDDRGTPQNVEDDRTSIRRNNDQRAVEGGLGVTSSLGDAWLVESGASLYAKEQGLPGLGAFQAQEARLGTERVLGQATLTRFLALGSVALRVQGRMHRDLLDDREGEIGVGNQYTDDLTLGGALTNLWTIRSGARTLRLALGGEWETFEPENALGPPAAEGDASPTRKAWVLVGEHDVALARGRIVMTQLLRLRLVQDSFDVEPGLVGARVVSADVPARLLFSPRLGARVALSDSTWLRAAAGRDHREPTFEELFGDRGAIVGNPELRPESAWTAEVGAAASLSPSSVLGSVRLDLDVFQSETTDLIQLVQNSQRTAVPVNLGKTRIRGVEAGVEIRAPLGIGLAVAYTLMDSEIRTDIPSQRGNRVPGRPLHDARAVLEERLGPFRMAVDADLVAGNFLDPANRQETPPRLLFGSSVGYAPGWAGGVSIRATVRNVFDRRVESVSVRPPPPGGLAETPQPIADYAGFPLPGRSLLVTLRYRQTE